MNSGALFTIIHRLKSDSSQWDSLNLHPALHVETCEREFWITDSPIVQVPEGWTAFSNWEGYWLLLKIATGLESSVVGETDVFGQIKEAWSQYQTSEAFRNIGDFSKTLRQLFQSLFEDAKAIRTEHLQGLGGSSYGTLVRKILEPEDTRRADPVLVVGAGKIARSIVPYFFHRDILVTNRTESKIEDLLKILTDKHGIKAGRVKPISALGLRHEIEALSEVEQVIFCTPLDSQTDQVRLAYLKSKPEIQVVHLGANRHNCEEWQTLQNFTSLDDVFDLQRAQNQIRFLQISRAKAACLERARMRSIGAGRVRNVKLEEFCRFG